MPGSADQRYEVVPTPAGEVLALLSDVVRSGHNRTQLLQSAGRAAAARAQRKTEQFPRARAAFQLPA